MERKNGARCADSGRGAKGALDFACPVARARADVAEDEEGAPRRSLIPPLAPPLAGEAPEEGLEARDHKRARGAAKRGPQRTVVIFECHARFCQKGSDALALCPWRLRLARRHSALGRADLRPNAPHVDA
jgi:hypothetical protein